MAGEGTTNLQRQGDRLLQDLRVGLDAAQRPKAARGSGRAGGGCARRRKRRRALVPAFRNEQPMLTGIGLKRRGLNETGLWPDGKCRSRRAGALAALAVR